MIFICQNFRKRAFDTKILPQPAPTWFIQCSLICTSASRSVPLNRFLSDPFCKYCTTPHFCSALPPRHKPMSLMKFHSLPQFFLHLHGTHLANRFSVSRSPLSILGGSKSLSTVSTCNMYKTAMVRCLFWDDSRMLD